MLAGAIKRVLRASEALAVHAIVVDAKNDRAKAFYERYGFVAFVDTPNHLYLPLDTVLKARSGNRTRRLRP
jgi:stage V sporulation protein SpoVS